jgi:hypothetical protein
MAKMTLLEMTQNILSAMNSDEVNSITDTVESQQVAMEIKTTYEELYNNRDIPELESVVNLEATGDDDRPNTLILPDPTIRLKWIKYLDVRTSGDPKYRNIEYLDPEEYIKRVVELATSSYGTYMYVPLTRNSNVTYTIATDRAPRFYTIFNDEDDVLTFDSFDLDYEDNLTGASSLAWGIQPARFELEDNFIPNIPENLFPHFLAEAKSSCFITIKEVANSKEEQRARRQLVRSQFRLNKTNEERKGVFDAIDYSRKR